MSNTELLAEMARLKAENEVLRRGKSAGLAFKVSDKGALSVYGMGRFPVTLYREQWEKLFANEKAIKQFIIDNEASLKTKEGKDTPAPATITADTPKLMDDDDDDQYDRDDSFDSYSMTGSEVLAAAMKAKDDSDMPF